MIKVDEWQDILDTRDILTHIEGLQIDSESTPPGEDLTAILEEIIEWEALLSEIRQYSGDRPEDGVILIRYSYFEQAIREEFFDCAEKATEEMMSEWPFRHIDWAEAAEEARQDYTEVTFREVEYWFR